MKNRKAFDIERIQLIYNVLHLLINVYLFKVAAVNGWLNGYSYRCQAGDLSSSGMAMRMATGSWWYFFSKFTDFFETFIFILGKRYDLVNFYHVAHHSIMPASVNNFFYFAFLIDFITTFTHIRLASGGEWNFCLVSLQKHLNFIRYLLLTFTGGHATFFGFLNSVRLIFKLIFIFKVCDFFSVRSHCDL